MKKKIIIGIALIVGVLSIYSCEHKEATLPTTAGPGGSIGVPTNCDTASLTYNSGPDSVSGIINTQCAVSGCHVKGGASSSFTSYTNIGNTGWAVGGKSSLFYTCLVNGNPYPMPNIPQSGWSDVCLKAKLVQWVLDGAPN